MSSIKKDNLQTRIEIPSGLSESARTELGIRILSEVRARTARGIDANGKAFKSYSKAYKESLDFKNAGKSSTVNISSTGDTMADLDIINSNSSSITIGYSMDYEGAGPVNGIVTGEFGHSNPVTAGRDFIGLPQSVVNRLATEVQDDPDFEEVREESTSISRSILGRFL